MSMHLFHFANSRNAFLYLSKIRAATASIFSSSVNSRSSTWSGWDDTVLFSGYWSMCGVRLPLSGMVLISLLSKIVSPYSVKCLPKVQGNLLGKHHKLKEMAPVRMANAIPTGAFIQTSILGAGNIHTEPLRGNRPHGRTNRTIYGLFTSNAAIFEISALLPHENLRCSWRTAIRPVKPATIR